MALSQVVYQVCLQAETNNANVSTFNNCCKISLTELVDLAFRLLNKSIANKLDYGAIREHQNATFQWVIRHDDWLTLCFVCGTTKQHCLSY